MAKKRRRSKSHVPPEPWEIRYFRRHPDDDPDQRVPGLDFIDSCPVAVQADLLAVRDAPPPSFAGGARWQAMHGQMKGYFEVRIMGPGKTLYRVFCMLERNPDISGLGAPSIVVIQGLYKPNSSAFTDAEYRAVRALGGEYRKRTPRSVI